MMKKEEEEEEEEEEKQEYLISAVQKERGTEKDPSYGLMSPDGK